MEILFDAISPATFFSAQDGGPKDPTECPKEYVTIDEPEMAGDEQSSRIDLCTFQHTPGLYRQACGHGYSVVCDPTGMGRIAVVDAAAADLLERFRFPTSLVDLGMAGEAYAQARAAVALFARMGFLEDVARSSRISRQAMSRTLNAWLHLTNACNLRCDYCYLEKTQDAMDEEIARRAVEAVFRSASKHGFSAVQLRYAGGEASLQGERVFALHDYALSLARQHRMTLHASLLSNGVFLARRTIARLKEREIGVMISLDGIGAAHDRQRPFLDGRGSFPFVERTIAQLLAARLVPHISVTVSQRNLVGLPELITYILERDLPFSLNYYRENDCSAHLADLQFSEHEMIETMREVFALIERDLPARSLLGSLIDKANLQYPHTRTCGVGHNYLVIDQRGGVAKCHADIKYTVATIAADDPLMLVRNDARGVRGYEVHEKEGCRSCLWRNWCGGGCPLLTYRATGRSDVKSPNCNIYQALFPDVLRLEALRLLKYVPAYPLLSA